MIGQLRDELKREVKFMDEHKDMKENSSTFLTSHSVGLSTLLILIELEMEETDWRMIDRLIREKLCAAKTRCMRFKGLLKGVAGYLYALLIVLVNLNRICEEGSGMSMKNRIRSTIVEVVYT